MIDDNEPAIEYIPRDGQTDEQKTAYEKKLEELLDSFSGVPNAVMSIYRQNGASLNDGLSFLDSFPPDKYTKEQILKMIRDNYGAGDYRLQLRVGGRIKANELVSIEEPKSKKSEASQDNQLIQSLMQRMDKMQEMLLRFAQQPQQRSETEIEMKMLEKMAIYKKLLGGDGGGGGGINEVITTVRSLAEIGFIQLPDKTEKKTDTGFGEFLLTMAPTLKQIIEGSQQRLPVHSINENNKHVQRTGPEIDEITQMLKSALTFCIQAARNNGDVEITANWALDLLPEVHHPRLLEMIEKPDWFEIMRSIVYVDYNLKPWFERLRHAIFQQFDDSDGGHDTGGQGGNPGNTETDESAG